MLSLYQKDVRDQKGLQSSAGGAQATEHPNMGENLTIGFLVMKVLFETNNCHTCRCGQKFEFAHRIGQIFLHILFMCITFCPIF